MGRRRQRSLAPAAPPPPAGEQFSIASLGVSLGLLAFTLLPIFGGGYSGAGYQLGMVVLPLAAALCWLSASRRTPLAVITVLLFSLGLLLLPLWLNPGRVLWFYLLHIPAAWIVASVGLREVAQRGRWFLTAATGGAVLAALEGWMRWLSIGDFSAFIVGPFGLHNAFAGFLLLAWPAAAVAALEAGGVRRRLLWIAAALLAVTLVFTYSKASIAVLGIQLLVLLVYGALRTLRAGRASLYWRAVAAVTCAALALLALPTVRSALSQLAALDSYSMQGRLAFWDAALRMFADHPWLGVGPGGFAYVFPQYQRDWMFYSVDPHSWPLQLLAELGLLGALIALAVLVGFTAWVLHLWRRVGDARALLLILAVGGSLAHAAFDFDYTFGATTALLGLLLAYGSWLTERATVPAESERAEEAAASAENAEHVSRSEQVWMRPAVILSAVLLLIAAGVGQMLTLERMLLDSLRNQAAPIDLRQEWLRQAIGFNPYNSETHLELAQALAQQGERESALEQVEQALELNPRLAVGYALEASLTQDPVKSSQLFERAIALDPFNRPWFYFQWARMASDRETRRERLALGLERVPAEHPITPEHVRAPDWYRLNPLWSEWWQQLSDLTEDPELKARYAKTARAFREYSASMEDPDPS